MGLIYTDKAGNKLYKKKLGNRMQIYAKNRKGKLVNYSSVMTLVKRAKRAKKY